MYVSLTDIKTFQAIFLLDLVGKGDIKTIKNDSDYLLEPLLIDMMAKDYIKTSGINYVVTTKGQETLDIFMQRYIEYLKLYDVFGFVDLEKAEFAFSRYFDFATDQEWDLFKYNPRFEDLRLAVAIFKKLNPAEIVFMSFINEGRFETTKTGWQIDLLSSSFWNEVEEICKTSIKPEQLGEDAMIDIIEQGTQISISLMQKEAENKQDEAEIRNASTGSTVTTVTTVVNDYDNLYDPFYYEVYYDPYFVSVWWTTPLFIW